MATFSAALELLKTGVRVRRSGWNGKGLWLLLITPAPRAREDDGGFVATNALVKIPCFEGGGVSRVRMPDDSLVNLSEWLSGDGINDRGEGSRYRLLPWIGMKTADDCFVPWLASQTDMLSDDWEIVS